MREIQLQGNKIYYREWGINNAPHILILHGWGVDSEQYEELGPLLAGAGFHIVVPDLPGWGHTPAPEKAWNISDYTEWVDALVHTLSLKNFVLFGHSFGGRIAIKYAIKFPNELRALVLCASAGIKPGLTLKRVGLYILAKIGRAIFKPPGLSFTGEILKKILYRVAGVNDYLRASGIMKEVLHKAVREDLKPLLPRIKVPTLLLWGIEDGATPYKDGQTMARLISNSKLVTFEGERHNLPKNIPEKVAAEIIKYLTTHSAIPRN